MNATQIQQLNTDLSRLRYEKFCQTLDVPENSYSEYKWKHLQALVHALDHFTPEILVMLVEAAQNQQPNQGETS